MAGERVNEVRLRGRVSVDPVTRTLPSGDCIVVSRIVIPRTVRRGERRTVDAIELVARRAGPQRSLAATASGDEIEVEGSLRRRFWRGAQGLASTCEVEVTRVKR